MKENKRNTGIWELLKLPFINCKIGVYFVLSTICRLLMVVNSSIDLLLLKLVVENQDQFWLYITIYLIKIVIGVAISCSKRKFRYSYESGEYELYRDKIITSIAHMDMSAYSNSDAGNLITSADKCMIGMIKGTNHAIEMLILL